MSIFSSLFTSKWDSQVFMSNLLSFHENTYAPDIATLPQLIDLTSDMFSLCKQGYEYSKQDYAYRHFWVMSAAGDFLTTPLISGDSKGAFGLYKVEFTYERDPTDRKFLYKIVYGNKAELLRKRLSLVEYNRNLKLYYLLKFIIKPPKPVVDAAGNTSMKHFFLNAKTLQNHLYNSKSCAIGCVTNAIYVMIRTKQTIFVEQNYNATLSIPDLCASLNIGLYKADWTTSQLHKVN